MKNLRLNNVLLHELWVLGADVLRHDFTESELELFIYEEVCLAALDFSCATVFWTFYWIHGHANT